MQPIENSVKVDITWDDSSYPTGSAVAAYVDITEGINYIAIVGETATAIILQLNTFLKK